MQGPTCGGDSQYSLLGHGEQLYTHIVEVPQIHLYTYNTCIRYIHTQVIHTHTYSIKRSIYTHTITSSLASIMSVRPILRACALMNTEKIDRATYTRIIYIQVDMYTMIYIHITRVSTVYRGGTCALINTYT